MTYLALARQYRPGCFAEIVGQEAVLKALTHMLTQQQLHHAYLLTGTRGVGKTSLARILAKCFNCETGITATPCNTCTSCQDIAQGRAIDVIEIDAASRTKVEDTRDLLENIQYAPQQGKYKVYIIDEVHMLSGHSFNALLKTLEEPPAHVIFILATTDPQKLPATILSRCLQFHLKNIPASQIAAQLEKILLQENKSYEKAALESIAAAAQGSMRDALSLLDACIAHGKDHISTVTVDAMLGGVREAQIIQLLDHIHTRNIPALLSLIDEFETAGADFFTLLNALLSHLQKLAVLQLTQPSAVQLKAEDIQLYYQIALLGKRDLPLAPDPKSGFIMIAIRMAVFTPEDKKIAPQTTLPADNALQSLIKTFSATLIEE